MKAIGNNDWLINQQKENRLERYKKVTLFRRYWYGEYLWETKKVIDIDKDIIKCGKVTWKADTDTLNVWKMGNVTLTVDNSHGKWYQGNTDGYFTGNYISFLSIIRIEVGFKAKDGSIYEVFSYEGLITKDGIQIDNSKHTAQVKLISLDYLIESVNAEDVSQRPVYPEEQYENATIFSTTTIGKTGSGWTTNEFQYKIVRIIGGTGKGQERLILSNTSDTLTVNTWETTPSASSDFEIVGDYLGVGNDSDTEFTTTQPGVGKILGLWQTDDVQYENADYSVSQLNENSLGAKITFDTPPSSGKRIVANYIYWYQNQTFKYLVEKILDLAGITNRQIQDVTFPEDLGVGVQIEWTQTSESDWNSGILTQADTSRSPGDIIADDDTGTSYRDYYSDIDYGSGYTPSIASSANPYAHKFKAYKSAYISKVDIYLYGVSSPDGYITLKLCSDSSGDPGTELISNTNVVSPSNGYNWVTFDFSSLNYRMTYGATYWWKIYRYGHSIGTVQIMGGTDGSIEQHSAYYNGASWDHDYNNNHLRYRYFYHPYYSWASHMSQTLDCGVDLTSYGKLYTSETLNSGTAIYYTKSNSVDSFPSTWNVAEWDPIDAFGNITSTVQRYLRVAVYFVPPYSGGSNPNDIKTPEIHEYTVNYYTTEYKPSLANFTDKNGKQAIETMAKLANYEMGFFTDFNSNDNMTWDLTYDASGMPTPIWTEYKSGGGGGSVSGGILTIESATTGYCYYKRVTTLNSKTGWTLEMKGYNVFGGTFQIEVADNSYQTSVIIKDNGYIELHKIIDGDDTTIKKALCSPGDHRIIKIERKGIQVKISVDGNVVLCSSSNYKSVDKWGFIEFGQIENSSSPFEHKIDYLRYNIDELASDTLYFPKYYFQERSYIETGIELKPDQNYVRLYNLTDGYDRVYNHIKANYGDYSYYANAETEFDEPPTSEQSYGKKLLSISGEEFLKADDTNVALGTAKRYYAYYKNPRIKFKVLSRYLFQINLSDKVTVYCDEPFTINGMAVKIIGIVLDIDKYTLDLDCEEII